MLRNGWVGFIMVATLTLVSVVRAGTFERLDCNFEDSSQISMPTYNFDYATQTLAMSESMLLIGEHAINMSGLTVGDPIFDVTISVQNTTGYAWTGYQLSLLGTGVQFDYTKTPNSNIFLSTNQQPLVLTYLAPNSVLSGQTVMLDFAINVASSGLFSFTLQQSPIPEPLTLSLFGLGSLLLIRKREK